MMEHIPQQTSCMHQSFLHHNPTTPSAKDLLLQARLDLFVSPLVRTLCNLKYSTAVFVGSDLQLVSLNGGSQCM